MAVLRMTKLSEIQSESVEWLWEGYIPRGMLTLIQGDGGEGKTTTALAIAAAVTTGKALPGGVASAPAPVILQNAEDSYPKKLKPTLEKCGADLSLVERIDEDECALTFSDERIEQAIVRTGAKLFICDPVQAFFGTANMNSMGSVRQIMKRLGDIAARHDSAILLVGHMNKSGGKAAYRGHGSVDIYAACRSVMTVGKLPDDDEIRAIVPIKNNLAPLGKSQAFGFDDGGFTWLGECDATIDEILSGKPKPESQFTKARRLIETALAKGAVPAADMEQMADEQGISYKTFKRAKEALGVISVQRNRKWYWEMPIDVEYTECPSAGQDASEVQTTTLVPLSNCVSKGA